MRFDRESWRRLYRHEPLEQRAWPLITRAVRDHLIRYPEDLDGYLLSVGGHDGDMVRDNTIDALCRALAVHPDEREMVVRALGTLLDDRYITVGDTSGDSSGTQRVVIRNFEEAQKTKEARKKAKQREKNKAAAGGGAKGPEGDNGGTGEGHEGDKSGDMSGDISGTPPARAPARTQGDETRREEKREEKKNGTRVATAARVSGTKRVSHKPVPLDEKWQPPDELVQALAEKHDVDAGRIRQPVAEFKYYWRHGKGAGKLRSPKGWELTFSNRIAAMAKNGDLYTGRLGTRAGSGDYGAAEDWG